MGDRDVARRRYRSRRSTQRLADLLDRSEQRVRMRGELVGARRRTAPPSSRVVRRRRHRLRRSRRRSRSRASSKRSPAPSRIQPIFSAVSSAPELITLALPSLPDELSKLMLTMSASRPARPRIFGAPPPIMIGGPGCCTGCGRPAKPLTSTNVAVHLQLLAGPVGTHDVDVLGELGDPHAAGAPSAHRVRRTRHAPSRHRARPRVVLRTTRRASPSPSPARRDDGSRRRTRDSRRGASWCGQRPWRST